MDCIEEVINIPTLHNRFNEAVKQGYLNNILDEIATQSKVEFNYEETIVEDWPNVTRKKKNFIKHLSDV